MNNTLSMKDIKERKVDEDAKIFCITGDGFSNRKDMSEMSIEDAYNLVFGDRVSGSAKTESKERSL